MNRPCRLSLYRRSSAFVRIVIRFVPTDHAISVPYLSTVRSDLSYITPRTAHIARQDPNCYSTVWDDLTNTILR